MAQEKMTYDLLKEVQTNPKMIVSMKRGNIIVYKGWKFCVLTCGTFHYAKKGVSASKKMEFCKGTENNWTKENIYLNSKI